MGTGRRLEGVRWPSSAAGGAGVSARLKDGKARAEESMSEERRPIARKAAEARWARHAE